MALLFVTMQTAYARCPIQPFWDLCVTNARDRATAIDWAKRNNWQVSGESNSVVPGETRFVSPDGIEFYFQLEMPAPVLRFIKCGTGVDVGQPSSPASCPDLKETLRGMGPSVRNVEDFGDGVAARVSTGWPPSVEVFGKQSELGLNTELHSIRIVTGRVE